MDINYYKQYEPIFGTWEISKKLGEGNFGSVFEINKHDFGKTYSSALKIITIPKNSSDLSSIMDSAGIDEDGIQAYLEQFVKKIVGEFDLMSKLKGNSNIVSYEDHQVIKHKDGVGWDILIRMELLTPMMTYMKSSTATKHDVIKLGIDICRALEICQKYNIIHRDIKPENIFISDIGDFKLGDFGIAREVEKTQSGLTKTGTPTYMAPEVYKGQPYGTSVDIYSLGVVMYRLLNHNRAPFMPQYPNPVSFSDSEKALMMKMGGHKFPQPSGIERGSKLAEIVLKACSFSPADRFKSPAEMRMALESIIYSEGGDTVSFSKDALDIKSVSYISDSKNPVQFKQFVQNKPDIQNKAQKINNVSVSQRLVNGSQIPANGSSSDVKKNKPKKKNKVLIMILLFMILFIIGCVGLIFMISFDPGISSGNKVQDEVVTTDDSYMFSFEEIDWESTRSQFESDISAELLSDGYENSDELNYLYEGIDGITDKETYVKYVFDYDDVLWYFYVEFEYDQDTLLDMMDYFGIEYHNRNNEWSFEKDGNSYSVSADDDYITIMVFKN